MGSAHVAIKSMDSIISTDDPTVGQAMEALASWEAESAAPAATPETAPAAASVKEPTTPATGEQADPASQAKPDEGTPATEATTPKPEQSQQSKDKDGKPAAEPSKYEKAQGRLKNTWEEVNREKELVRTTAEAQKQRAAELEAREKALTAREAKLTAPRYKPEDYENHATSLEAEAKKLEEAGDYAKADRLKYKAEDAREYAKQLRANPPKPDPTEAEQSAAYQARQKEWWGKAAVDYPAVIKDGTPERNALLNLLKSEPDIVNDPKGMYYASRLVVAETSAARVPQLAKDLEAANARVKELEQLTAVPSDGSVPLTAGTPKSFEQMSPAEQLAQLESEARTMSSFS